eukprot:1982210-Pyramimonas_sp.AAC.1
MFGARRNLHRSSPAPAASLARRWPRCAALRASGDPSECKTRGAARGLRGQQSAMATRALQRGVR